MSGLTPTGFVILTTDEILTNIEQDELNAIDPALDTAPDQPLGQINGVFASEVEDVWQGQQACYGALDPDNAEGQQQDVVGALSGIPRNPASSSIVYVQGTGTATALAAAVLDKNGNVVTPGAVLAQIAGHPELGTFTNAGVFIGTTTTLGAAWNVQAGQTAIFVATQTGPTPCNAGTLTVISPPVTGLTSITNSADGVPGSNIETDTQYRIRREAELVPPDGGTNDSMRATLLAVKGSGPGLQGVINATVFENDGNTTDGNGLPPHSTMAVIWDGSPTQAANNDIAQAIWNSKASGIQPYDGGSGLTGVALDDTGVKHTIGFARATALRMYQAITVAVDSTFDAVNGPTAIAAILVAYGNALVQGQKVVVLEFIAQALTIQGVRDVTVYKVDTVSVPVNTANFPVGITSIARFGTADVTVTTTPYS